MQSAGGERARRQRTPLTVSRSPSARRRVRKQRRDSVCRRLCLFRRSTLSAETTAGTRDATRSRRCHRGCPDHAVRRMRGSPGAHLRSTPSEIERDRAADDGTLGALVEAYRGERAHCFRGAHDSPPAARGNLSIGSEPRALASEPLANLRSALSQRRFRRRERSASGANGANGRTSPA